MAEKNATPGGGRSVKAVVFVVFLIIAVAVVILLQGKDGLFKPAPKPRVAEGLLRRRSYFPGLDGRMVDLKAYRGKVVFLNIWATWCPPCRDEMPSMERLYRELKGEDFEILAVSVDAAGAAAVAPFMKKYQLSSPPFSTPRGRLKISTGRPAFPRASSSTGKGSSKRSSSVPWTGPPPKLSVISGI